MPWIIPVLVGATGAVVGGAMQAKGAKEAAQTSAAAADRAAEVQRQMFERQVELQEPWRQAGMTALNKLIPLSTEYTPFGMQQFQQDPGYAFRMGEGMKALERSAAARGGLLSGAALRGIQRYGQDLASQEYQNAFNRYQAERQARLGPLQSLAGVGQTATQALTGAASQYGTNIGNIGMANAANVGNAMLARGGAYNRAFGDIGQLVGRYYSPSNFMSSNPYGSTGTASYYDAASPG